MKIEITEQEVALIREASTLVDAGKIPPMNGPSRIAIAARDIRVSRVDYIKSEIFWRIAARVEKSK